MNAIRLYARGGPEALVYGEAPIPTPDAGDVLVRVHAAAVTPTELEWVPTWTTRAKELLHLAGLAGGPRSDQERK